MKNLQIAIASSTTAATIARLKDITAQLESGYTAGSAAGDTEGFKFSLKGTEKADVTLPRPVELAGADEVDEDPLAVAAAAQEAAEVTA